MSRLWMRGGAATFAVILLSSATYGMNGWSMQTMGSRSGLAVRAALYALPLVIMDVTREEALADPAAAPNRFSYGPGLANASSRMVVRPNVDTLVASAWLDLTAEPVVMTVPPSDGRYFVIQCMDAWTNTFADPGIRTLGNAAAKYAIVGPEWHDHLPAGVEEIRSPTRMVWVLARAYVRTPADLPAARTYQRQLDIRPVSRVNDASSQSVYPRPTERNSTPPTMLDLLKRMGPEAFFERFMKLTVANPPAPQDAPFVKEVLDPLGISPGTPRSWDSLDSVVRQALATGLARVLDTLSSRASPGRLRTPPPTVWSSASGQLPRGTYGTNYPVRAAVAAFGLGANLPADAIYLNAGADRDGKRLDGGKEYRLTFNAGSAPPARAFWSVTLYDDEGYLVPNPLGRYAIRSGDDLVHEPDGSLVIYLQPVDPGPERHANWLPTPRGQSYELSLRAYWPERDLLEGRWTPPPVVPSR